jgi:hypothetical protein
MRTNVNEIRLSALPVDESLTRINDGKRPVRKFTLRLTS